MVDQTIFEEGSASQNTNADQAPKPSGSQDQSADLLQSITNEDGTPKYDSVEKALNALKASQEHISTLENENATYKHQLQGATNMNDILEAINASSSDEAAVNGQTQQPATQQTPVEDVRTIAAQAIKEHEATKTAIDNQKTVALKLRDKFGEKAQEVYTQKASQLGLTVADMNQLASKAPEAALAYFAETPSQNTSLPQGTVNTDALPTHQEPPKKFDGLLFGASSADVKKAWKEVTEPIKAQYTQ